MSCHCSWDYSLVSFFDDHLFTFKNLTKMNGKGKYYKDTYVCLRHWKNISNNNILIFFSVALNTCKFNNKTSFNKSYKIFIESRTRILFYVVTFFFLTYKNCLILQSLPSYSFPPLDLASAGKRNIPLTRDGDGTGHDPE